MGCSSSQGTSSSNTRDHNTPPTKELAVKVKCDECGTLTEPVFHLGDWKCTKHAHEQRQCDNSTRGCTYSDFKDKCRKHEYYYCQYSTECRICWQNITTLDSHYMRAHGDITHRAGTVCTVSPPPNIFDTDWLIIDCDLGGRAVCMYRAGVCFEFMLWVHTALPAAQLYKYRCRVELSHPDTGRTLTRTLTVLYDTVPDWCVSIPYTDYAAYFHDGKFNIKINITEIDDPRQFIV